MIENLILRVARKQWACEGDGRHEAPQHAPDCSLVILPREHYVEYVGESAAYQSGSRHSPECTATFYGARIEYADGGRSAALVSDEDALRRGMFELWQAHGAVGIATLDLRAAAQHAQAIGDTAAERAIDGVLEVREAKGL